MSNAASQHSRRRNGQQASCEPCRKAKIRCDHGNPCSRCRRRSIASKCFYHPAPLTKVWVPNPDAASDARVAESSSKANVDIWQPGSNDVLRTPTCAYSELPYEDQIAVVVEVLQPLRKLSVIREMVHIFYQVSKSLCVPGPLVLPAFEALSRTVESCRLDNEDSESAVSYHSLAGAVLQSTSERVCIDSATTPSDFISMHTGESLRLQYLGLLYSIAARTRLLGIERGNRDVRVDDDFTTVLSRCSTVCLRFARDIAPMGDAVVWLSLDNTLLTTNIYGDSSEQVWQRLGDLSSDIIALGIHRESFNTTNSPFFLSETRRKTFSKAFGLDMSLSTVMNRPPRILRRYSDCKMPLDLTDAEIVADPATQLAARIKLTADGWNTDGRYTSSTFNRVRCWDTDIRQEIMDYEYRPATHETAAELQNLLDRTVHAWNTIPSQLKYTSDCWYSGIDHIICLMLCNVKLGFMQAHFHVHRIMERSGDQQAAASAIKVACDMMELNLQLGRVRSSGFNVSCDFSFVMLCYGLPTAVHLATTLQKMARQGPQSVVLPPEVTRSSIIRSLSVFLSQLDSVSEANDANRLICREASQALARTLDEVLDAPPAPKLQGQTQAQPTPPESLSHENLDAGGLNPDGFDAGLWDGYDLSTWFENIDWTGVEGEWNIF